MIQNPRYLPAFLICATIFLLLDTLHTSSNKVPKALAQLHRWSRYISQAKIPFHTRSQYSAATNIDSSSAYDRQKDTQHDVQHDTPHGEATEATSASKNPIFGGKNHDNRPTFTELALKSDTDKVATHNYGFLYDKSPAQLRDEPVRMIEIGLGCGMSYGPGHSNPIWTTYFPEIQLNIMEYDKVCGYQWAAENPEAVIFFGDQSSVVDLCHIRAEVTADNRLVDIIFDDGGHTMDQQITSLLELWSYLRPGGIYFAEDLQTSFIDNYGGDGTRTQPGKKIFIRWIHELVDDLMASTEGIASIDCMAEMCVLTKKEEDAPLALSKSIY